MRLAISIQVPGVVRVAPLERKTTELTTIRPAWSARAIVKRRSSGRVRAGRAWFR